MRRRLVIAFVCVLLGAMLILGEWHGPVVRMKSPRSSLARRLGATAGWRSRRPMWPTRAQKSRR